MLRSEIFASARLAGGVRRYHTWPMLTVQTVAEHSYHVLRIWVAIFGPPRAEVTMHILMHDLGELVTGDLPFPVKSKNTVLKHLMDGMEKEALAGMGYELPALTMTEHIRAKCCDLVEMHELGVHEALLGNRFAQPIIEDTYKAIEKLPLEADDAFKVFQYLAKARKFLMETP